MNLEKKNKNYLVVFDRPDANGNIWKKGSITNIDKFGMKEDEKGIFKD